MNSQRLSVRPLLASCAVVFLLVSVAHAGPPLLCRPFDIGNAKSLPFPGPGWSTVDPAYDVNRLVGDTEALLGLDTPVLVRMETLRRATIYAREHREVADALLARLQARVAARKGGDREALLARFDLGYLVETYRQAAAISRGSSESFWRFQQAEPKDLDGYALVAQAIQQGGGPEMEFAAAVITADHRSQNYFQHLQHAQAGAKSGSLLARNLETHFAPDLKAARASNVAEKR